MTESRTAGDRLSRIETLMESVVGDIRDIKAELHAATESAFPRTEANLRSAEIDRRMLDLRQAIAERLEVKEYSAAHDALIQRVARLENAPQRQLGWIALGVSGLGCLGTFLGVAAAVSAIIVTLVR